jgi:hypothetical protein
MPSRIFWKIKHCRRSFHCFEKAAHNDMEFLGGFVCAKLWQQNHPALGGYYDKMSLLSYLVLGRILWVEEPCLMTARANIYFHSN